MKKILTGVLAVSLLASLAISASALEDAERTDVTVYRNTPTIDGVINDGEWDQDNAIDITADNAKIWVGDTIDNLVYFYYSWDDNGLYLAADVSDTDVVKATDVSELHGSKDAFQFAMDPGGMIAEDGTYGGAMFYTIGPLEDGSLGAVYHPYGGAYEEFDYTGLCTMTDDGWQFEMIIPWTSVEILGGDGYDWKHADGETINALLCVLDRGADGSDHCYQLCNADSFTFAPIDYPLELHLSTFVAPSLEVEEPVEDAPVEDAPAESAP
ncbi:MAG: hypothetical protein IJ037_06480, partial [Clostridia bacterium]|nr:hypothetical protein [Clostridia bacterium]